MSEQVLGGAEPIRRSPVGLVVRMFALIILIGAAYVFMGLLAIFLPENFALGYVIGLWVIYTLLNILVTVFIVRSVLRWMRTSYFISGHRIIERDGLYKVSEKMCDLHHLEAVDIRQGWLGHRLHYGNIVLGMVGPGYSEKIELCDVADPEQYENVWYEASLA